MYVVMGRVKGKNEQREEDGGSRGMAHKKKGEGRGGEV